MATTECQGEWRQQFGPWDEDGGSVLRCTECGELMVIFKGKAYNFPKGWGNKSAYETARWEDQLK